MSECPCGDPYDEHPICRARPTFGQDRAAQVDDAVRAMFDLAGCDCDLGYRRSPAPYHASDCPVYERWQPHERKLRRVASALGGIEQKGERDG